jgi:hypothetical protein
MNATISRLHGLDPARIGLGDFGKGENYVARQVERESNHTARPKLNRSTPWSG